MGVDQGVGWGGDDGLLAPVHVPVASTVDVVRSVTVYVVPSEIPVIDHACDIG